MVDGGEEHEHMPLVDIDAPNEEPPRSGRDTATVSRKLVWTIGVFVVLVVLVGWSVRAEAPQESTPSGDTVLAAPNEPTSSTQGVTLSTSSATTPPPVTSTVASSASGSSWLRVNADATWLRGTVVVAPHPAGRRDTETPIWVLGADDRLVSERQAPLWPGDVPYPLVLANGRIVFADLDNVHLLDTALREPPMVVSPGSFVVPGGTPGRVWVIGEGARWVAALDTATGAIGERIDVSASIRWPLAGVSDGMLVEPIDEQTYGRYAYWTPALGLQPIDVPDHGQTGLLAAAGNSAVFLSPQGVIRVMDIPSREYVSSFEVDLGEDLIIDGCLSPQQFFIAITGSSGRTIVVSTDDGTLMQDLTLAQQPFAALAWTTPDQLLAIIDSNEGNRLQAIDVFTGTTRTIADLDPRNHGWWITASGSNC